MSGRFEESFHKIESRFKQIKQGLGLVKTDVDRELAELRAKIMAGANRDYVAAFGERMSAILMAEFLGATFVDPMTCVHIGPEGQVEEETYQLLGKELGTRGTRYVLPGFYEISTETSRRSLVEVQTSLVPLRHELREPLSTRTGLTCRDCSWQTRGW